MNSEQTGQNRHPTTLAIIVAVIGLLVIIAIAIPSFFKPRYKSAQQACIDALRIIDGGKEQCAMVASLPGKPKTPDILLPTREQALNVGSNLTYGMSEAEIASFLETNGFIKTSFGVAGNSFWLTRFCRLSDGTLLCLEISPKNVRADNAWGDGTLETAYIREENTTNIVVTIELRNQEASRKASEKHEPHNDTGVFR
jgi:hypothetical protein